MITTLVYRDNRLLVRNPPLESLRQYRSQPNTIMWVDLSSPNQNEARVILEDLFELHPLVIEDAMGESELPKLEYYDDYMHLIMHAVDYSKSDKFTTTGIDMIMGRDFLISIHRQPLRPMQLTIERYSRLNGPVVRGVDRFAHTVLDFIVEAYKPATEELNADLLEIENDILGNDVDGRELFPRVASLRKDLAQLRQIVRPQREIASVLAQTRGKFFRVAMLPYLRDLSEDLNNIERHAGAWADQLLMDFRVFLNKSSNQANEGIRVITALTALMIPPLLFGAWYGMNFVRSMHELKWKYAYPVVALITLTSILLMVIFMRRRRWL